MTASRCTPTRVIRRTQAAAEAKKLAEEHIAELGAREQSLKKELEELEVNREELALLGPNILGPIVQRVVADNDLFFNVYRDTQLRIVQGKA